MKGGSVVGPSVVKELLVARRRNDPLAALNDNPAPTTTAASWAVLTLLGAR
jgi:hypothetical protein